MTVHTTLLGLALLALVTTTGFTDDTSSTRYTFTEASEMRVEGTSTIHGWVAEVGSITGGMEITGRSGMLEGGTIVKGSLAIPVAGLDTDNGTMNKKMRAALKAESHEKISYELVSAVLTETPSRSSFRILARGKLTLAGVQKPVEITLNGEDLGGGALRLKGSYTLQMSDFGIKPPTAMLGTMKTGDEVTIHFDLVAAKESA